jgi:glutamyl-tRNA(Gln) amidotransferase subunit D
MNEGDSLSFTYEEKQLEGILIQLKDEQATIKLNSGYNIIVPVNELKDVKSSPSSPKERHHSQIHQNEMLPPIVIIHTGGTIAAKVDYRTGGVVWQFDPEELIAMFPELSALAHMRSFLLRNMASDDMRFAHYNLMARSILEEVNKGVAGIILTQGTDTLHYTAAALSFALEGLNIPVVIVGSQRSSDRGSTDANTNLLGAVRFIIEAKVPGVFVAMHESGNDNSIAIISGVHVRKNHTSRRDAFISVNAPLIARVKEHVEIVDGEGVHACKARAKPKPQVIPFKEDLKVGLWKAHPHSFVDELLVYDHYDGLLIEATGLGHCPINAIDEFTAEHARIKEHIKHLAKKMPVAIASQTIFGRVNMNVYSPGRELLEFGVMGQYCDMHPETAFIKLAWLLSNHSKEETHKLYGQNMRGEISARSPLEDKHNNF